MVLYCEGQPYPGWVRAGQPGGNTWQRPAGPAGQPTGTNWQRPPGPGSELGNIRQQTMVRGAVQGSRVSEVTLGRTDIRTCYKVINRQTELYQISYPYNK